MKYSTLYSYSVPGVGVPDTDTAQRKVHNSGTAGFLTFAVFQIMGCLT